MFSVVTELLDYLCEHRVTTLIWAVSALCLVAQFRGFTYKVPESVNKVLFSGEQMPAKFLSQWQHYLPKAAFVNLYGPTRHLHNCTCHRVDHPGGGGEKLPIGQSFPNERVFLLDGEDHEVTEPNVQGERCAWPARHWRWVTGMRAGNRRPKAFVPDPLNPTIRRLFTVPAIWPSTGRTVC